MPSPHEVAPDEAQTVSDRDLELVRGLIADSNLIAIDFHEVSVRRLSPESVQQGDQGNFEIEVQTRYEDDSFGVRLNGKVTFPGGEAVVSVAGEYELLNDASPVMRTIQIFANEVAVMNVYPYLREAISTATGKVFGEPILLPIVDRGQISVTLDAE